MTIRKKDLFARKIAKIAATLLTASMISAGSLTSCSLTKKNQPNIVLILTDDQGFGDIGVYGCTDIDTPNMDKLAGEGVRFTNFYSSSPVCTPSRAGLLTGSYPKRVGMGDGVYFPNDQKGLNPDEVTIADMLKEKDYSTLAIGKWHLGRPSEVLPTAQGFDHYYGVPYSNDLGPDHFAADRLGGPFPKLPLMEDETVIDEGTDGYGIDQTKLTKLYTDRAVEFINGHKKDPFFLYLAYNQPHYPNIYGKDYEGASDRGKFGDAVEELDWSLGEIMKTLEENGLDENTLVIFTSDNGPWKFVLDMPADKYGHWSSWSDGTTGSSGPLRGWKTETYEGGQRVPAIMRWPGKIPEGKVTDALASNLDILPTIAEITQSDISGNPPIDGHSLAALIKDPENEKSPDDYFLYYDADGLYLRAVRNAAGYKLQILDEEHNRGDINALYYLPEDIHTDKDISAEHPEIVEELLEAAGKIDDDVEANMRPQWERE